MFLIFLFYSCKYNSNEGKIWIQVGNILFLVSDISVRFIWMCLGMYLSVKEKFCWQGATSAHFWALSVEVKF